MADLPTLRDQLNVARAEAAALMRDNQMLRRRVRELETGSPAAAGAGPGGTGLCSANGSGSGSGSRSPRSCAHSASSSFSSVIPPSAIPSFAHYRPVRRSSLATSESEGPGLADALAAARRERRAGEDAVGD